MLVAPHKRIYTQDESYEEEYEEWIAHNEISKFSLDNQLDFKIDGDSSNKVDQKDLNEYKTQELSFSESTQHGLTNNFKSAAKASILDVESDSEDPKEVELETPDNTGN